MRTAATILTFSLLLATAMPVPAAQTEMLPERLEFLKGLFSELKATRYDEAEQRCMIAEGSATLADLHAVALLRSVDKSILEGRKNLEGKALNIHGTKGKVTNVSEKGFDFQGSGIVLKMTWDKVDVETQLQAADSSPVARELWRYFNVGAPDALKKMEALKALGPDDESVRALMADLELARGELEAEQAYAPLAKALERKDRKKAKRLAAGFLAAHADTDFALYALHDIVEGSYDEGDRPVAASPVKDLWNIQQLFRGKVEVIKDTTCRFSYDFKDPNQLQDWAIENSKAEWTIENGAMRAPRHITPLWLKGLFVGDVTIELEATGEHFCRIGGIIHGTSKKWEAGYMFQLLMYDQYKYMNLKHYKRYFQKKPFGQYRKGKRYHYRFVRKGSNLQAYLDRRLVMQGSDSLLTRGYLGLLGGCQAKMVYHRVEVTATLEPEWVEAEIARFKQYRKEAKDPNAFPPPKLNITLWKHEDLEAE